ncbi:hypothetical protein V1J52_08220 [Streptomyces sp. TRM 70351]|uniref:hypothetical protein n=1 Tax=Streptomyces sp. TRM 70351 TaxID=3116552 RepID=UPI002E7ABB2B|nr:hypothetical protein [Streptomyces sp. TRM 70351]MEE1928178.1 hypothetical protein [Streptomyces sp. TRM 70351]
MTHVNRPRPATATTGGLRRRLAELRGPGHAPRPLDARALSALAANPGCRRRALLDGAGVDKTALARALGVQGAFGQSQFAFARGHAFEARVHADGGAELVRLLRAATADRSPEPAGVAVPDVAADGPEGRAARTRLALEAADEAGAGVWTVLVHPMLELDVAGAPVHLEPDAVAVAPDGRRTVIEVKSFPILDGTADPAKVGAAVRQSAVYALALEALGGTVADDALLVCPKDFSNLPTAAAVDLRRQLAAVRRQLTRLTRLADIAAELPEDVSFDVDRPAKELSAAVEAVPAAYAPECLAACELAFHCRSRARATGDVTALGRSVRGELGGLRTVEDVLAAAHGAAGDPSDPAVAALRRAARLRAEALGASGGPEAR